jgi:hypothetical protein
MNSYWIYGLVAVLVILCLKSLWTVVGQECWRHFFPDPAGEIVPQETKKRS